MGPGRDSEGRFLKRTTRSVEHKRCFAWSANPAQPEQAVHMCDLDRVTSLAVKDSRQRDGNEPVNNVKKSLLRSLAGVLGYLATDRLDLQFFVKNLMREVTRSTCGTLSRARGVVRYFVRKQHLAWSFPAGTKLEYLDVHADSYWRRRRRSARAALVSRSDWDSLRSKRVQRRKVSSHSRGHLTFP